VSDERDELIFLYAAGALEGDERDEVESWLAAADPAALGHLAAAEAELARLGRALPPVVPSPAVKQRLLRRIAATTSPPGRRTWLAHPALAAGIAALAAGFLGAAIAQEGAARRGVAQVAEIRTQLEAVTQDLAEVRGELDQARTERSELDREILEQESARRSLESDLVLARKAISVLGSEKAEALALAGTSGSAARGRVVWDWKTWYCYLHLTGLAGDPARIYALWLYSDTGEVVGLGPFEANAQGEATLVAPVPHDLGRVVRVGVSIEPDGDLTAKPRGEVVLLGEAERKRS